MYLSTGQPLWYHISYYNMVFGITGALLAAIPGFIDYFTVRMTERAKNTATTHMLLNLTVVVLFVINVIIRYGDRAMSGSPLSWAIVLDVAGVGLLAYSGWLGADLVHRYGVAVDLEAVEAEAAGVRRPGAPGVQPG